MMTDGRSTDSKTFIGWSKPKISDGLTYQVLCQSLALPASHSEAQKSLRKFDGVRFSFASAEREKWSGFFRCERILSTATRNLGVTEFFPTPQLHCFEAQEFFRYANGA